MGIIKQALLVLLSSACLFISCSSGLLTKQPDWVNSRNRADSRYFHGYAQVERSGDNIDYISECHDLALGNIAKSISANVIIQSERKINELERLGIKDTYNLQKSFDMVSSVRSEMTLDRVDNVGEWEDDRYYYVYKRLSIEEYEKALKIKITNAIQSSINDYQAGHKYISSDPFRTIGYFISAYRYLVPYKDHQLIVLDPITGKNNIHLDMEIKSRLVDIIKNFNITNNLDQVFGKIGKPITKPLQCKVNYVESHNEEILSDIPIHFFFTNGDGDLLKSVKTDDNGIAESNIIKIKSSIASQTVRAELGINSFLNEGSINNIIADELYDSGVPNCLFDVRISPSLIYLDANENLLGSANPNPIVVPALINTLEEQLGFQITPSKQTADYILEVNIETNELGELYSLFTTTATLSFYFKEEGKTIFANNVTGIKGTHTSYILAANESLKKLALKVKTELVTEIVEQFLE